MVTAVCSVPVLLRTGLIRVFEVDNIINENREPLNAEGTVSFLVVREVDLAQSLLEASFQLGVGRSVEAIHVRMAAVAAIYVPLREPAEAQSRPILRGKKGKEDSHDGWVNIGWLRQTLQLQRHYRG